MAKAREGFSPIIDGVISTRLYKTEAEALKYADIKASISCGAIPMREVTDEKPGDVVEKDLFICGFACAISTLIRGHDRPEVAADIMNMNGFTIQDFEKAGVVEYDLAAIRKGVGSEPHE